MIAKASVYYARISPRKVRYVIDLIRHKKVTQAQGILNGTPRRAGEILRKLLNQAVDAASKNSQVEASELSVSKVTADGGPMMKRFRAMSMGRAGQIRKRTSHIHLELDLIKKSNVPAAIKPATKAEKPASKPAVKVTAKAGEAKQSSSKKKAVGAK